MVCLALGLVLCHVCTGISGVQMVLGPTSLLGEVFQVQRCWALLARATKRQENKQEMLLLPSLPVGGVMVSMLEGAVP